MAVTSLQASVTVSFGNEAEGLIVWEEERDGASYADSVPFRLYPPDVSIVYTTSGNLIPGDTSTEDFVEIMSFSKDSSQSLAKPGATDVVIRQLGSFRDEQGDNVDVTLSFDPITNKVSCDATVFGIAEVSYSAPYRRYELELFGGPCPVEYERAMLVAVEPADDAFATADVDPDECSLDVNFGGADDIPKIVVEVDENSPPSFIIPGVDGADGTSAFEGSWSGGSDTGSWSLSDGGLSGYGESGGDLNQAFGAGTRIRISPSHLSVTTLIDHGKLTKLSGGDFVDVQETFKEVLRFSGNSSAILRYTPSNTVGYDISGRVYDPLGRQISAGIARPGERIKMIQWNDDGSYQYIGSRKVQIDELVLVDSGREVPGYATVIVEYDYKYNLYDLLFGANKEAVQPTNIIATTGMDINALGRAGRLTVDPPRIKGV